MFNDISSLTFSTERRVVLACTSSQVMGLEETHLEKFTFGTENLEYIGPGDCLTSKSLKSKDWWERSS